MSNVLNDAAHMLAAKMCVRDVAPPAESLEGLVARMLRRSICSDASGDYPWPTGAVAYPVFQARVDYCRRRGAGHADLLWSIGETLRAAAYRKQQYIVDEMLKTGVVECVEPIEFLLRLSVVGLRMSFGVLRGVIDCQCFELFEKLYEQLPEVRDMIEPRSLLLWLCADGRFSDDGAVQIVQMLDRVSPGLVSSTVDFFGDTPLWYTLYRWQFGGFSSIAGGWQETCPMLEKELISRGCPPLKPNSLGLTWRKVSKEIAILP